MLTLVFVLIATCVCVCVCIYEKHIKVQTVHAHINTT